MNRGEDISTAGDERTGRRGGGRPSIGVEGEGEGSEWTLRLGNVRDGVGEGEGVLARGMLVLEGGVFRGVREGVCEGVR